jgi:hypothetical protein
LFTEVGAKFAFSSTESGWQTQDSFYEYVTEQLVKDLDERGVIRTAKHPFLYFVDGHSSHDSFKLFRLHRNYKKRNYGIMTSDLVIQQCEEIEAAKEIAEAAKIDRQNEREDLKRQRQVSLDLKKNQAEERSTKKRKAAAPPETLEVVKPKRGRPKKSA